MLLRASLAVSLLPLALAQIATFRATVEGSLHQCQDSQLFFFDSGGSRPLSVLFLPSANIPDSARNGTVQLEDALAYGPVLALGGIETDDAAGYDFTVQLAAGTEFELFGFLPDGEGKDLSLTRTVMTPLPSASACLTNVPTTLNGVPPATTTDSSVSSATETSATTSELDSSSITAAATSTSFVTLTTTSTPSTSIVTVPASTSFAASATDSTTLSTSSSSASAAASTTAASGVFASGAGSSSNQGAIQGAAVAVCAAALGLALVFV